MVAVGQGRRKVPARRAAQPPELEVRGSSRVGWICRKCRDRGQQEGGSSDAPAGRWETAVGQGPGLEGRRDNGGGDGSFLFPLSFSPDSKN